MTQIGQRFGVSRQRIHQRLKEAGVQSRPNTQPPIFLDRQILYQLFILRGLTMKLVGEHLGVSPGIVSRELRRYKIARPVAHRRRCLDRDLLYHFYVTQGLDQREVAGRVGLSLRIVRRELRRHNIEFRHRPGPKTHFTRDQLSKLYIGKRLTCKEVGKVLHINEKTVSSWLKRYGITVRRTRQFRKGASLTPNSESANPSQRIRSARQSVRGRKGT
jgi:transposase